MVTSLKQGKSEPEKHSLARHAAAFICPFAAVAVVTAAKVLLAPWLGAAIPYGPFFFAVAFTAFFAGFWPAVLATVLSALTTTWFFLEPPYSFAIYSTQEQAALAVFLAIGLIIAALGCRVQRAKKTAESLARRARATFDQAGVGIVEVEGDDQFTAVNDRVCEILGYSRAHLLQMNVHDLTWPEDRDVSDRMNREVHEGVREYADYEKRYIKADGSPVWVHVTVRPVHDEEGRWRRSITTIEDISERKRVEERLMLAQQAGKIGVFEWNIQTGVNTWSRELEALYGLAPGSFDGTYEAWKARLHPQDVDAAERRIQEALSSGGAFEGEWRVVWPDGAVKWLGARGRVFNDDSGSPQRMLGVNVDITERKRAEEAARANAERFRLISAAANDVIWEWDLTNDELEWNEAIRTAFGYRASDVKGAVSWWHGRIHPEDRKRTVNSILAAINNPLVQSWSGEYRFRHSAGRWVSVLDRGVISRDSQGKGVRMIGSMLDLTASKQAEAAVRESQAKLEAALSSMTDAVVISDYDGRFITFNQAFAAFSRFRGNDERAATLAEYARMLELFFSDGRPASLDRWPVSRALQGETAANAEYRLRRRDTGECWIGSYSFAPIRNERAEIAGCVVVARDITERKGAEEALRGSEEKFRAVFEQAAIGMGRVSFADARWIDVNSAFCRMLGYTDAEMRATPWPEITHPDDVDLDLVPFQRMAQGELDSYTVEKRFLHKAGRPVWTRLTLSLVRGSDGRPSYEIAIIEDITERKRLEEELRTALASAEQAKGAADQANRAKDQFLAVLSHELRTPLTPVLAALSLIRRRTDLPEAVLPHLEIIKRNVAMEAHLIDDLLDLTRIARGKVALERAQLNISDVLRQVAEVCRPDIDGKKLHFAVSLPEETLSVHADSSRLQQVFWNLLKNAIKFTPGEGCVKVSARGENGNAVVEVIDSGIGIEQTALSTIFDAFEQADQQITRQFGGLGLGLAITKRLIEMHGGNISAHSAGRGLGAVFRVVLPTIARRDVPLGGREQAAESVSALAKRILLVEDHGDTAQMMKALLENSGHQVEVAADVDTALKATSGAQFDLLISDIGLPDKSGFDLMRTLRQSGNKLRAIAVSGFGRDEDVRRSKEAGFVEHLTKPVDYEVLERAVERVMQQPPA